MTMAEAKIKQWGNSLGLIIPKEIVKHDNLNKGDIIKIDIIKRSKSSGFGKFKRMRPFKREKYEHEDLW